MDTFQAVDLRAAHDADARKLSRMSAPKLREVMDAELAKIGQRRISGGGVRRDELVSEILDARYPREAMAEATHVMYHKPGESWSACTWCAS